MSDRRTVFAIDDDAEVRESICALITSLGYRCRGFPSAESFLAEYSPSDRGVLIVDLRMPGMSGLQLQEELVRRENHMPIIFLTAFARTEVVVKALQAGAVTAIDKPYYDDDLWDAVRQALEKEKTEWTAAERRRAIRERIDCLTDEERQVSDLIVGGHTNKSIAQRMDLALRTVEKRRHNVFAKLGVESVAEMVALFVESRN